MDSNSELSSAFVDSSDSEVSASKKTFKCSVSGCKAVFSKNSKLIIHTRKHTGERPFVCKETGCNKTYTNNSHLRRHQKVSHGQKTEETILCDYEGCGAVLSNKYSLKKHYYRRHNPELYRFKCNECSQGFHRKRQLQQHSYLHTGEGAFSCDKCDMNFATSYTLNKHKRSHRVYSCNCGETFHRWTLLLAHKKICRKFRFTCDVCSKTFTHLGNFNSHKMVHKDDSEKEIFVCPFSQCERIYIYEKNLKFHIASYHEKDNGKRFKCTYDKCNMILKTKQCLKMHLKRHFEWRKKKVRQVRRDKGKVKKSIVATLIGDSLIEKQTVETHSNIDKSIEDSDPILKECDLVLERLMNEQIVGAS